MDDGTADKAGFRGPFLALHDHILSFLFMHGGSSEILSSQEDEQIVLDPSSHIAAAFLIMQVFSMKNQTMRRELEVSKGQMEQSVNGLIDVMQKFRQKRHPERPSNSSSRSPLLPSAPISLPSRVSSKGMDTMLCIHQCLAMQAGWGSAPSWVMCGEYLSIFLKMQKNRGVWSCFVEFSRNYSKK